MTYEEALRYLTGLGRRWGMKLNLDRMQAVLDALGHPELGLRGILVAGTNGKGSVAAMASAILGAQGLTCGQMPSPHLSSYTERILCDGRAIAKADLAAALAALRPRLDAVIEAAGPPTEFEVLTGLAITHLVPRVDRFVCEVGLGGRLDATNVLDLGVAVVTNVALDHQQYLGDTVEEIAANKADIIKPGNRVVTGATPPALGVVEAAADRRGARLWRLGEEIQIEVEPLGWAGSRLDIRGPGFEHLELRVPLLGLFQAGNAALAVAAAHASDEVTDRAVREGLLATRWPGRLELVAARPRVLLDGAHNLAGAEQLAAEVHRLLGGERLVILFAAMGDHNPPGLIDRLRPLVPEAVVCTQVTGALTSLRAAPADELAALWGPVAQPVAPPLAALGRALTLARPSGNVLVCGSLYLVGELRPLLVPGVVTDGAHPWL